MDYFTNRSGLKLSYSLSIKNQNDRKINVICQWLLSDVLFNCDFLIEYLEVNTFKFFVTGCGNSEGEYLYGGFERDAGDIDDAVKFLVSQGYEVEAIIGYAKGGNDAIIYSALFGDVKKIIAIAPAVYMTTFNLPDFFRESIEEIQKSGEVRHIVLGKEYRFTSETLDEFMSLDMDYYCDKIKGDIYLIHGTDDDKVPYSDIVEYCKELGEKCKELFTLNNCDHFFTTEMDEVVEIIHKIIESYPYICKLKLDWIMNLFLYIAKLCFGKIARFDKKKCKVFSFIVFLWSI
ncbi:unnamed protein product [Blepharisma stoltei]|uniref:Peptidase S9 prolyl oligopeptidase catalytic domain-containing protein n=1 Tax=Blepharisma stoltei TaxID=1481888 RepID=A0AAU9I921_9CILI|nr:unnamed protein product [Blepharisma stoltei]